MSKREAPGTVLIGSKAKMEADFYERFPAASGSECSETRGRTDINTVFVVSTGGCTMGDHVSPVAVFLSLEELKAAQAKHVKDGWDWDVTEVPVGKVRQWTPRRGEWWE